MADVDITEVITPATNFDFLTVAELKTYYNIDQAQETSARSGLWRRTATRSPMFNRPSRAREPSAATS